MPDAAPTSAVRRQRRHRERRRAGIFVVPVQVTGDLIEALIKRGDLDEMDARDLDCVGEAIAARECLLLRAKQMYRRHGPDFRV